MSSYVVTTVANVTSRYVVEADSSDGAATKVEQGALTLTELESMCELGTDDERVVAVRRDVA